MGLTRHVVVTGGTGLVGRFIVEHALARGDRVTVAGRQPPAPGFFSHAVGFRAFALDPAADYTSVTEGADAIIHGAFDHLPGRYRGGEGDDPAGFTARNLDGTLALHRAAEAAGAQRFVFLSSRAVYGRPAPGTRLHENDPAHPDTLYGEVKRRAEQHFAPTDGDMTTISLRITGVYGPAGPGRAHKWVDLYRDYLAGTALGPRPATEVHGADVASAVETVMTADPALVDGKVFNVSDVTVDRADILAPLARLVPDAPPLPPRGDAGAVSPMAIDALHALGWRPGGRPLFDRTAEEMATAFLAAPPQETAT